jgi:hypothetical protein
MDIISAYGEVGTYRGAAVVSGTTHKTVRRVIARHEAGGRPPVRVAPSARSTGRYVGGPVVRSSSQER